MNILFWFGFACWSGLTLSNAVGLANQEARPPITASECAVSVDLASGRTFSAVLDARTDAARLWLRFRRDGGEVLRPIDWDRIVSVEMAGQKLSGDELHRLVERLRQEIPVARSKSVAGNSIVMIGAPEPKSPLSPAKTKQTHARRVVSLSIDVRVGRWDENVDSDGLVVRVYPLDADGTVVPVRGTLNVDLNVGYRGRTMLRQPFLKAGYWTEAVHATDFGPSGAVYRLRFQSIHPEFDDRVQSPGLIHASLTVPGQGTFEASYYLSAIRPFDRMVFGMTEPYRRPRR